MSTQQKSIYLLLDPDTEAVRYVGQSVNPKKRLLKHLYDGRNEKGEKGGWINHLLKSGKKPLMEVVETIPADAAGFWEKFWIQQVRAWGFQLTNECDGFVGGKYGNSTSFKEGASCVPVLQFSSKGEYIAEWPQYADAPYKICRAVDKKGLKAGGFFWVRKETWKKMSDEQRKDFFIRNKREASPTSFVKGQRPWNVGATYIMGGLRFARRVIQWHKGEVVQIFRSCSEAAEAMGCIAENIRRCCVGKSKSAKGFYWTYESPDVLPSR